MATEAIEQSPPHLEERQVDLTNDVITLVAANREEFVDKVWMEYVQTFLINSNHVTQAAIFDRETGEVLASSSGFRLREGEFSQILEAMGCPNLAHRLGVTVDGHHYQVRLADGRFGIYARTRRSGCSACQTFSLLIVGVHDATGRPERCNEEVMRLGDFFRKKGL